MDKDRSSSRLRTGMLLVVALVAAGALVPSAPLGHAAGCASGAAPGCAVVAFQANTGELWTVAGGAGLGMMAGTSPAITAVPNGYQIAFQANTTDLWTTGAAGTANTRLGMMPGTSPAITAVPNGYQIAFQANTTELWTTGAAGTTNTRLGMMPGTSPAIAALANGGYQIAFEANTAELWTWSPTRAGPAGLGMLNGTSPAITALNNGGYQIAFQANTTELWTTGTAGTTNTRLGMMPGTSPAITAQTNGYQVAFQANTTDLWTTGTAGTTNTRLGMKSGTSPAVATSGFVSSISTIDAALANRMRTSWRPGCPVALSDLRYITVTHRGFDGSDHQGELVVAASVTPAVVDVFHRLYDLGYPIASLRLVDDFGGSDDQSMAANNSSAFNCRAVTGGGGFSEHSYGTAIDLNPVQNPYVSGSVVLPEQGRGYLGRPAAPGVIHSGDPVVAAFAAIGWKWGGSWSSPIDYQHFSLSGR